jgi:ribosomal protein S4E
MIKLKFEVGDEVRVIKGRYAGERGYIIEVDEDYEYLPYRVNMQDEYWEENGYDLLENIDWLSEDVLELDV